MTKVRRAALALAVVAVVAIAAVGGGTAASQQAKTVTIGWAYDGVGNMAAYDGPARATAKERVAQLNKLKSNTTKFKLITCNTQGNKPAIAKACASKLVSQGADIIMAPCDVDYAAPVVQYAIDRGKLTVAACIGTDQMGPKRFGAKGRLAFSFGNVAQDEGSAMAEYAWKRGWRTASLATDTVIVYFRNVVQAFKARWTQLGGKIATEETYQSAGGSQASWQNTVTRLNAKQADVIVTSTAPPFGAQVPIITGLRTLGNNTPILNSWAGDGNYWYGTLDPKLSNYYYVTFASAFGDDPVKAVNALRNKYAGAIAKGGSTGAFVTGWSAIDGINLALKRTGGNANGAALAAQMEKFKNVPTLSGLVTFSKNFHTVSGRTYRVIRVTNNTPKTVGVIKAKVVPKI
jgi:branched-chain amino acid transport system substrate-binding protein